MTIKTGEIPWPPPARTGDDKGRTIVACGGEVQSFVDAPKLRRATTSGGMTVWVDEQGRIAACESADGLGFLIQPDPEKRPSF